MSTDIKLMKYNRTEKLLAFISKNEVPFLILAIFLGIFFLYILMPVYGMSPVWSVPYFSGAANTQAGGEWMFAPAEVVNFKALQGFEIYHYQFKTFPPSGLAPYSYNTTAYLYIVKIAHFLLPFLGQVGAVVALQLLVHVGIVAIVGSKLPSVSHRLLFILLYAVNPLVLYITIMPFYYFWSGLGSAGALLILKNPKTDVFKLLVYTGMIIIGFLSRATVFPLIILAFMVLLYYRRFVGAGLAMILVFGSIFLYGTFINQTKGYGPWHTAFIGIGAYPNPYPYLNELSDDRGIERYEDLTGIQLSTSIGGNYYQKEIKSHYSEIMQEQYLQIVRENPGIILRNVILNTLQFYSIGHFANQSLILNLLISFTGLAVLSFLFLKKAYGSILLIFLTGFGVALMTPPIPAYNFATYLVLIFSIISALSNETSSAKKSMV